MNLPSDWGTLSPNDKRAWISRNLTLRPEAQGFRKEPELIVESSPEEAPIFTKKVIGFRNFRVDMEHNLHSCGVTHIWTPGVNKAYCKKANFILADHHNHAAPAKKCECGLYVMHSLENLQYAYSIIAVVAAWGKMEVHPDGVRAEYAEIVMLVSPSSYVRPNLLINTLYDTSVDDLKLIGEKYGVPVVDCDELDQRIREGNYGEPLPDDIKPEVKPDPITSFYPSGTIVIDANNNRWVAVQMAGYYYAALDYEEIIEYEDKEETPVERVRRKKANMNMGRREHERRRQFRI